MVIILFSIGQKVWDKYAGKVGTIASIASDDYYYVNEDVGKALCLESDLLDYDTATTFRNGDLVRVKDIIN